MAHIGAIGVLAWRLHQTRNTGLIGIIFALGMVGLAYVMFTYNAWTGQSNAPLRYFLRLGNGSVALSIVIFSVANALTDRKARLEVERALSENANGP